MKIFTQALSLILLVPLAVACGGEDTPKTATDAGTATDSGAATDGGGADTGTATDAAGTDTAGTDAGAGADAGAKSDGGAVDAGPAPSITTCPALADCVMSACVAANFAAGCETKCLDDASAEALTPGAPLLSCTKATCVPACKDSKEKDCIKDCITDKCGADFGVCIVGSKDGAESCSSTFGCVEKCEADPKTQFTCTAACFDKISLAAKKDFGELMNCADDAACAKSSVKCLTGGKSGAKTCAEGVACASKCSDVKGEGAQLTCVGKCSEEIKADQALLFIGAASCGADFEEDCGGTMATCMAPTGTDKCADLAKCAGACKEGDDACIPGCVAKGSVASAGELLEFALSCEADLPTCGAAFLTCMAPDGTESCATTVQCVSSCPKDKTEGDCIQKCVLKVKATSADLLKPALTCGAKNDKSAECKAAIGKCVADQ